MDPQLSIAYNNPYSYKHIEPFISKAYKGTYYIYYTNLQTGKRTKKTTKTKNQREANRELEKFRKRYYNNVSEIKINRVSELMAYYRQNKTGDFRPRTLELYDTAFKKLINVIGDVELNKIIFLHMDHFKAVLVQKLKKNSVNIYLRTLKAAFNFLKAAGVIYDNPMNGVKMFKIEDKDRLNFENEDMSALIDSMDLPYLQRLVKFNLETGVRLGELVNIQRNDIDFVNMKIKIRNKDNFKIKTNKQREFTITPNMLKLINENPYKGNGTVQQELAFNASTENVFELDTRENNDYVFGKVDGKRFSPGYISKLFKSRIRRAGFDEKYHFHCLRHTAITNMANAGIPLHIIGEMVGHKKWTTTQQYVHSSLSDMRRFLNEVNYSGLTY